MALTMQAIGCSSIFASGATVIGSVRGSTSPSVCKRVARNLSPRSSPSSEDEGDDEGSGVDYEDTVAAQWLSADFLDLRLRSSGLMCNEAIQALRNHFQRKDEQPVATATKFVATKEHAAPSSTSQLQSPLRPLPNVRVLDDAFFSHMYSSNSTYSAVTKCSFLDESFY